MKHLTDKQKASILRICDNIEDDLHDLRMKYEEKYGDEYGNIDWTLPNGSNVFDLISVADAALQEIYEQTHLND